MPRVFRRGIPPRRARWSAPPVGRPLPATLKTERVERGDYHRYERSAGAFTRTLALPVEVEFEKATARYTDGVLEIRAPKSEHGGPAEKKIDIT